MIPSATIIGAGNTAWHVARVLSEAGWILNELVYRDAKRLPLFADYPIRRIHNDVSAIHAGSTLCFLCVPDRAISEVAASLPAHVRHDAVIVHMSGTTDASVLETSARQYGCLWPIQTLVAGQTPHSRQIPVVVIASCPEALDVLTRTGHQFGPVYIAHSEQQKQKMHLTAVMTGNFIFGLLVSVKKYCDQEQLDFTLLAPLIRESMEKGLMQPNAAAQTGPAARRDSQTLEKHRNLLANLPEMRTLYDAMTHLIQKNQQKDENHW
jgi:predicted short-subunit dehydrogenase-like oxidoreductase (DUF2520 family)